ncbi:unnamed protein product [Effrenium voratum]|nr:unnamed protein product [Effrenium voratum]
MLVQPSLAKGMPFHNGFLYKLGDGLLNKEWNLRYFLLIGTLTDFIREDGFSFPTSQTLQYYRSQHEARPRDAINLGPLEVLKGCDKSSTADCTCKVPLADVASESILGLRADVFPAWKVEAVALSLSLLKREFKRRYKSSGVTVEWLRDQSRPFTFAVSKSGQRSFCLSGTTEKEACEWVERIQARTEDTKPRSHQPGVALGFGAAGPGGGGGVLWVSFGFPSFCVLHLVAQEASLTFLVT